MRLKDHSAEQIEVRSTIDAPFNLFQPVDKAFHRAIAPGERQSRLDRIPVLLQPGREPRDFPDAAVDCRLHPLGELLPRSLAEHRRELLGQVGDDPKRLRGLAEPIE